MAIKQVEGTINVVEAGKMRIKNAFDTGLTVKLSISGGKDSIVLANLVLQLIRSGEVDAKQLVVQFIDEEAIHDDVAEIVHDFRRQFLLEGAKFDWYCLQIKHFNTLATLDDDESFIAWDRYEKENWVRQMPKFAIKTHPKFKERAEPYQPFLERINKGSIVLIGIRTAESAMRSQNMATIFANPNNDGGLTGVNSVFPIYDWSDDDIWLFIKEHNLDFPITYMQLWQIGVGRRRMRLSQFFTIDAAVSLVSLNEFKPGLMERIIKREPNAYLASLYWDTSMFGNTRRNKNSEIDNDTAKDNKDYKKLTMALLRDIENNFDTPVKKKTARDMRLHILRFSAVMTDKDFEEAYGILQTGDPKNRKSRGWTLGIMSNAMKKAKIEDEKRERNK